MSICSNCTPNTEHSKKLGLKVRLYPIALIVSQSILDSTEKGERRHTEAIEGYNRVRHNFSYEIRRPSMFCPSEFNFARLT